MRRRDVLRSAAAAAALPVASSAVTAASRQDAYAPLGSVEVGGAKEVVVGDAGETAYVAATDGFATVDVSDPENPAVLARVAPLLDDTEAGAMQLVYDVKVEGDTLLVVGPANPPGQESSMGALTFDVSDPASPTQTGFYETDFPIHNAFLEDGVAYLTANDQVNNPVVIVDVSGDANEELARWSNVDVDDAWQDVHWYLRSCHDVYVQDGMLYVAYWDAGTWLVDVSDPANPEYVTHFGHFSLEELRDVEDIGAEGLSQPGNAHYVAVNDDASLLGTGAESWDANPEDGDDEQGGIDIWDVSNPENPEQLSTIAPPPTPDGTRQGTWTTSHNFEFRGDRLYTSWYQGGVKIHDVSDPANPEQLAWWRQPDEAKFWTAQYATEDAFVASSMAGGDEYPTGVFTFPNRAGEQANPPSLEPTNATTTAASTTSDPTTTQTTRPTTQTTAPPTTEATTTEDSGESGGGASGFGVLAALSGVGAAALAAKRRLADE